MNNDIYKSIFSKNLTHYMRINDKNQTDLMNDLGYSSSTISNWCTGLKMPRMDKIQVLADYFRINKSDLLEDKTHTKNNKEMHSKINVFNHISVTSFFKQGDIVGVEEISEQKARTGDFFGLQIHGDSMAPKMEAGDIVIVRKQDDIESGRLAIVTIGNDNAICRQLFKNKNGISLVAFNNRYEPLFFSEEEIIHNSVKIIGRVTELRIKF